MRKDNMPNGSYDPKLSEAGFMDLVCALQERLKTTDGRSTLEEMPEAQRDAAFRLGEAAKAYVNAAEGRANGQREGRQSATDSQDGCDVRRGR